MRRRIEGVVEIIVEGIHIVMWRVGKEVIIIVKDVLRKDETVRMTDQITVIVDIKTDINPIMTIELVTHPNVVQYVVIIKRIYCF